MCAAVNLKLLVMVGQKFVMVGQETVMVGQMPTHAHPWLCPCTQGQPKPLVHNYKPSRELSSAATLLSNEFRLRCAYCDSPHFSASCSKVNSVRESCDILLRSGKCFNCLKSNHKVKGCHSKHTCRTCHKRHHQSICDLLVDKPIVPVIQPDSSANQSNKAAVSNTTDTASLNVTTSRSKGTILLQTAQAMAVNPVTGKHQKIRILVDNGSQHSYITESLCSSLNLQAENNERLQLNTFGDRNHRIKSCSVVQLELRGVCTPNRTRITVLSFPIICITLPSVTRTDNLPHLEGLELADNSTGLCDRIDILVGSDFYWDFVSGDIRTGDEGPIAVKSNLGWLLSGPVESTAVANLASSHMIVVEPQVDPAVTADDEVICALKQFWETESLGINLDESETASDCFLHNITFVQGHYQVGLPWKRDVSELYDHFNLSFNRLKLLQSRLLKKPKLLRKYDRVIKEQLDKGIIEIVERPTNTSANCDDHKKLLHYLPHHAVVRKDREMTKIRVAYDGSARDKDESYSLNDCLLTGPNYVPMLFDVLLRFRTYLVALTGDIEKAFLMIRISEENRDALRLLWLQDPLDPRSTIVHFRFTRLVFGLRPSPAILGSVISDHLSKCQHDEPALVGLLQDSLYVDDLVTGVTTVEKAFDIYNGSRRLMADAGMNLRKWNSNSTELMNLIQANEHSESNVHSC